MDSSDTLKKSIISTSYLYVPDIIPVYFGDGLPGYNTEAQPQTDDFTTVHYTSSCVLFPIWHRDLSLMYTYDILWTR
jgi:hypothetical protein